MVLDGEFVCITLLGGFPNSVIWCDVPCVSIWWVYWGRIFETGCFDTCICLEHP